MNTSVVISLIATSFIACAADTGTPTSETTGTTSQCIVNGDVVTVDNIGTPILNLQVNQANGGGWYICSSTQLTDTLLLTAHHCATNESVPTGGTAIDPSNMYAQQFVPGNSGDKGSPFTVKTIYLHPTYDVAIIELVNPMLDYNGGHHNTPIYSGASADLIGQTVYCQGWGSNARGTDEDPPGAGVLRSAYVTAGPTTSSGYSIYPNACGQIPWRGDSGSACLIMDRLFGKLSITGVNSWGWSTDDAVIESDLIGSEYIRDWVNAIISGDYDY